MWREIKSARWDRTEPWVSTRAGHQVVCGAIHRVMLGNESVEITDPGLLSGKKDNVVSCQITCKQMSHPGVLPWEIKGGIKNFKVLHPKACLYRQWSSQVAEWKLSNTRTLSRKSACVFFGRLGAEGKPGKEAEGCLPPWNLAAKILFQSFSMSGRLGVWI